MPEPIKTRGKLERRGDWSLYGVVNDAGFTCIKDARPTEANPVIDAACEVLNKWGEDLYGLTTGGEDEKIAALREALTTAGCVREVEVERFYHDGFGVVDRDDIDADKSYVTVAGMVAELNRLSQQAGQGE